MDVLVIFLALVGIVSLWRICAEMRLAREALQDIARTHIDILYHLIHNRGE